MRMEAGAHAPERLAIHAFGARRSSGARPHRVMECGHFFPFRAWEVMASSVTGTPMAIASALYLRLLVSAVGHFLWLWLLRTVSARTAASVQFLQRVFGMGASTAMFGDRNPVRSQPRDVTAENSTFERSSFQGSEQSEHQPRSRKASAAIFYQLRLDESAVAGHGL